MMRGQLVRSAAFAAALLSASATSLLAQFGATPSASYEGQINYVVTGTSLRQEHNDDNACAATTSGSATLSGIPAGATVIGAWLYWAGSGNLDQTVTFAGSARTADRTWTTSYNNGGTNLSWFGAVENVTSSVTGNGSYTLSNLAVNEGGGYCSSSAVVAGWGLFVIYSDPSAPLRRIELRDGFFDLRFGSSSVTLSGFLGASSPGARFTLLTWEGDDDILGDAANPERVRFNGSTISTPNNNAFNNTINSQGRTNAYGQDLDTYDVSTLIAAGARTATLDFAAGSDLVLPHAVITSVNIQLVDVTPKGLPSPVVRLGGGSYSQTFQVENAADSTEQYDLIARFTGTPAFITIDSVTGPGMVGVRIRPDSMRMSIPRQTTRSFNVWYRVSVGTLADNVEFLLARSVTYPTRPEARSEGWQEIRRGAPNLTLAKSVTPNTNIAPGMDLTYSMIVGNGGPAAAEGIVVSDDVPTQLDFRVGSPAQTLPGGFAAVVEYSNDGGATWTYVPVSGACGAPANYDRCVRAVRWRLTGALTGAQTATLSFIARVR